MQTIKPEIIELIKNNTKTKNRLAYAFNRHITTIDRWLNTNDAMLTTATGLSAIKDELDLNSSQILNKK